VVLICTAFQEQSRVAISYACECFGDLFGQPGSAQWRRYDIPKVRSGRLCLLR
jgi:hypothetical protein